MERFFKYTLIVLLTSTLFSLASCQEGSEAGDLLGQWRMSGSDKHYVSFSGSVARIRIIDEGDVFGKFQHAGDSLFIQCVSIDGIPSDTIMVEERYGLGPFTDIRLKIETLDSDHLVLTKGQQLWSFYKY